MTDEARIARLTEIARRVWQHSEEQPVTVECGLGACVRSGSRTALDVVATHDRALDALEAALLVLADEERIPLTERRVFEDRIEALERDRATLVRRYRDRELEQAAWVEDLAEEWSASAAECRAVPETHGVVATASHLQAGQLERCARELRERAKRGGEP